MSRKPLVFLLLVANIATLLFAQKAVDPSQRYYRLICLVHLTGSGRQGDPIIPEYVAAGVAAAQAAMQATPQPRDVGNMPVDGAAAPPASASLATISRPGIIAWGMQMADDKQMAIVQVVAADRHAFDAILNDKRPEVRVFEIGKHPKEAIEQELRKFKKDFDLTNFRVMAQ